MHNTFSHIYPFLLLLFCCNVQMKRVVSAIFVVAEVSEGCHTPPHGHSRTGDTRRCFKNAIFKKTIWIKYLSTVDTNQCCEMGNNWLVKLTQKTWLWLNRLFFFKKKKRLHCFGPWAWHLQKNKIKKKQPLLTNVLFFLFRSHESSVDGGGHLSLRRGLFCPAPLYSVYLPQEVCTCQPPP